MSNMISPNKYISKYKAIFDKMILIRAKGNHLKWY